MSEKLYGIMAEFNSPGEILRAAEKVNAAGYRRWDVFSPFPIHGIDKVMNLGNSLVGWVSLALGAGAFLSVVGLIWYANDFDYPLIVGGKQPGSWQGFVPIVFETTVLLGAFGTVGGLLYLCRLPRLYHPVFRHPAFSEASDDAFLLAIEATDPMFNINETTALLNRLGGTAVSFVEP